MTIVAPAPDRADAGDGDSPSLAGQAALIAVGRTVSSILAFILPVTLSRSLDQGSFGEYRQLFLIAVTVQTLFGLGIPASLYFFVPRSPVYAQRILERSTVALAALGLLAGLCVAALSPLLVPLLSIQHPRTLYLIAAFIALSIPGGIAVIAPTVDRRMVLAAQATSAFELLRVASMSVAAFTTHDVAWVLMAAITVMTLQLASLVVYLIWRRYHDAVSHAHVAMDQASSSRAQVAYSTSYFGAIVANMMREQSHAYVVAASFDPARFAVYSVGTTQVPLIPVLARSVHEVAMIRCAELHARGDGRAVRELWWSTTTTLLTWSVPVAVLLDVFARDLIVLAFGARYAASASVLRMSVWILPGVVAPTHAFLRATNRTRAAARAESFSLAISLASLVPLLRWWGPIGAAASVVVGHLSFQALASGALREELSLSAVDYLRWGELSKVFLNALVSSAVAWGVFAGASGTVRALFGVPLAVLLFAVGAWKGKLFPSSDRAFAIGLFKRWRTAWSRT